MLHAWMARSPEPRVLSERGDALLVFLSAAGKEPGQPLLLHLASRHVDSDPKRSWTCPLSPTALHPKSGNHAVSPGSGGDLHAGLHAARLAASDKHKPQTHADRPLSAPKS